MKKYILTEEDREEIFRLLKTRSTLGVKNYLNQLEEIKEDSDKTKFKEKKF